MRAFVALELPPRFADEVAALSRRLALAVEGRFVPRENHHLTLAFLGDVYEAEASAAVGAVERACAGVPPVRLRADGLGTFGRPRDATLWMGVVLAPELRDLVERLRGELDACGLDYDRRAFRPHVTLARRARLPQGSLPALEFPNDDEARTATLFKSLLDRDGATYKPLFSVRLGEASGGRSYSSAEASPA